MRDDLLESIDLNISHAKATCGKLVLFSRAFAFFLLGIQLATTSRHRHYLVLHPKFDGKWSDIAFTLCRQNQLWTTSKMPTFPAKAVTISLEGRLVKGGNFGSHDWKRSDMGANSWIGQSYSTLPLEWWLSPSLKQVPKKFENDLLRHLGKDISLLKSRFDGGDIDFLLNDLLAPPVGFDGVVFAARSKLRRWRSCKN